ncbi:MAG: dephospho-CoA kinase [Lentisphaeria bacterium]|nr:dephospho-CoA kinase [Lentisphaeria bacterium]
MILGITGAFGCGKSTVLRFFAARSWRVFDADSVCKSLYDSGEKDVLDAVRIHFGAAAFTPDGRVNPAVLGQAAFRDPAKMAALTGVLYPKLTEKLEREIAECRRERRSGAFEIPLLYENKFESRFDAVLTVWAPESLRRERLRGRNFTDADVDRRSRMQWSAETKLELADYAVINTGEPEDLAAQLREFAAAADLG